MADANVLQTVTKRIGRIGDRALARSAPLYVESPPGTLQFLGSAVLLVVADAHFLVTAGHCLDEGLGKPLYAGGEEQLVAIGGAWRHSQVPSSGRAEDVIDLAVLALPDYQVDSLGAQFLTLGETDPEHQPDPTPISGTYYLVVGFPASRQSTWLREGTLLPRQIYLTLKPGPEAGTIHPNYRSDWNLTLDFDKEQGAGSGGRKQAMPDPVGMSGGGIWAANGLLGPDPRAERLVAIATTWHRNANVIIGTRIGLCFDAIAHLVPAIGHLLPWPRA